MKTRGSAGNTRIPAAAADHKIETFTNENEENEEIRRNTRIPAAEADHKIETLQIKTRKTRRSAGKRRKIVRNLWLTRKYACPENKYRIVFLLKNSFLMKTRPYLVSLKLRSF